LDRNLSDDDILHLYQRVAETCPGLSIIVQDLPSLTGVYMSTSLLARIASTVPSVTSIKLESPPTIQRIATLREDPTFETSKCTILCGLGALYAGFDLRQGISGFMTGFAFPEIFVAMMDLAKKNDGAFLALYQKYLDLIVFEQQPGGLTIRKEIYRRRGLIDSAILRHPGGTISPILKETVEDQLHRSFPGVDLTRPLSPNCLLAKT
jgi:4-hydroxy-tetrahydrodipicolinate synthase